MREFLTFLDGPIPGFEVPAVYNSGLVLLSYLVAAFAAYTALDFAGRMRESRGHRLRSAAWIVGGALAMGAGIWGMHFIGMLAFGIPVPMRYDLPTTLLSLAVAILLSGFALALVTRATLPKLRLVVGGIVMGLGVVVMHYTGMAAVRMEAVILYSRGLFALSVLNAMVCSTVALWLVFRLGATSRAGRYSGLKIAAALFMGLAIAGMHYTAMYAGVCVAANPPGSDIAPLDPTLQSLVIFGVAALFVSVVLTVSIQSQIVHARQRASERRLALVMDNVPAMIAHVDAADCYQFVNRAYAQWLGASPGSMIGHPVGNFAAPQGAADAAHGALIGDAREADERRQRLIAGGRVRYECPVTAADGQVAYADVELIPDLDERGRMKGYYLLATDVTHRRTAEEQLRAAKDAAESADKTKSRFLASMSHEIRTPMNGVLGMAELLLGTRLEERQRKFAQGIHRSGNALLGIINDILDFSKIEAGKLDLDPTPFDLRELCDEVMALLGESARSKDVELDCQLDPALPHGFVGDSLRIRQIMTNLIGNAIKFTEQGRVSVQVEPVPADLLQPDAANEDSIGILVRVVDTGIGMSEETLQRLFTAFSQADATTTRRFGGTGLGLAISKQLAQMMGGGIGAHSRLGGGSTFWFTVRLGAAASAESCATAHPRLGAIRALIVEDNPTNRSILEHQLGEMGMRLDAAPNGQRGLDMLRAAAAAGTAYDLALVDRKMPLLDGIELLKAVRADAALRDLRMIMLSSPDRPGEVDEARAAGADAYLVKPVRFADLSRTIGGVMGLTLESPESAVGGEESRFRGARVLLAEDNSVNREIGVAMLESLGCIVTCAGDGREAIDALRSCAFEVVLMDCQMPILDGFAATAEIRQQEAMGAMPDARMPRLPIVALTANAMRGDRDQCLAAGMDDYLAKPFSKDQLRDVLERWVVPPAPAAEPVGAAIALADPAEVGAPILDPAALDAIRELERPGRPPLVARIIDAYQSESPKLLVVLRDAVQACDAESIERAAHSLRSSSANLGATRVAVLCKQIETDARSKQLASATTLLQALESEYRKVAVALRSAA